MNQIVMTVLAGALAAGTAVAGLDYALPVYRQAQEKIAAFDALAKKQCDMALAILDGRDPAP